MPGGMFTWSWNGRPVTVGARITGFEDAWAAVRAGQAVACSPACTLRALPGADLVTRPVRGIAPAVLGVCRREGDHRDLVQAFNAVAVEQAEVTPEDDVARGRPRPA